MAVVELELETETVPTKVPVERPGLVERWELLGTKSGSGPARACRAYQTFQTFQTSPSGLWLERTEDLAGPGLAPELGRERRLLGGRRERELAAALVPDGPPGEARRQWE